MPKSLENYSQEIGRSGRDGEPATCHCLACSDDINTLENFVYGDTPTREAIGSLLDQIFTTEETDFDVSYYGLAHRHDIRILVVRTILTYLELEAYLEGGTPFYSQDHFKPLMTSREILANFEGERRKFLASLFSQARKATVWCTIDLEQDAVKLGQSRDRLVRALDFLASRFSGMRQLVPAATRLHFRHSASACDRQCPECDHWLRTFGIMRVFFLFLRKDQFPDRLSHHVMVAAIQEIANSIRSL